LIDFIFIGQLITTRLWRSVRYGTSFISTVHQWSMGCETIFI